MPRIIYSREEKRELLRKRNEEILSIAQTLYNEGDSIYGLATALYAGYAKKYKLTHRGFEFVLRNFKKEGRL